MPWTAPPWMATAHCTRVCGGSVDSRRALKTRGVRYKLQAGCAHITYLYPGCALCTHHVPRSGVGASRTPLVPPELERGGVCAHLSSGSTVEISEKMRWRVKSSMRKRPAATPGRGKPPTHAPHARSEGAAHGGALEAGGARAGCNLSDGQQPTGRCTLVRQKQACALALGRASGTLRHHRRHQAALKLNL